MTQFLTFPDFYAALFVSVVITAFLLSLGVPGLVTFGDTPRGQRMRHRNYAFFPNPATIDGIASRAKHAAH